MTAPVVVVDASAAVKWFRPEPGSDGAHELLLNHANGDVLLALPDQGVGEVLATVGRLLGPGAIPLAWAAIVDAELLTARLDDPLVQEAARQCGSLRCGFYDALAPALAVLLDAELVTADARAHARFPKVRLLG